MRTVTVAPLLHPTNESTVTTTITDLFTMAQAPNVLPLTRAVLHTAGARLGNDTPSMTANGTASGAAAELDAGRSQRRPAQVMTNDAGRSAADEP